MPVSTIVRLETASLHRCLLFAQVLATVGASFASGLLAAARERLAVSATVRMLLRISNAFRSRRRRHARVIERGLAQQGVLAGHPSVSIQNMTGAVQ